jgi:orotidine-5'-phosphate decarboxylase
MPAFTTASRNRIIVALDTPSESAALKTVGLLRDRVWGFKVGSVLFTGAGPGVVRRILALRSRVFLDLKYHDIPATVEKCCAEAARLGVSMLNVHAGGGSAMMRAAAKAVRKAVREAKLPRRPTLLGVTALTSLDHAALKEVGIPHRPADLVKMRALLARKCGLDGVVASPEEAALVKRACGRKFVTVIPGIRPKGSAKGDQKRTLTPSEAVRAGADYLVIGRPITGARSPSRALDAVLAELDA